MKVIIITIMIVLLFTNFIDFKNFKNKSLGSKYNNISKFYNLLKEFKEHQVINPETKECKIK